MCTPQLIQQAAEIKAQSMSAPSAVPSPLPGQQQIQKVYPDMPVSGMFEAEKQMRPQHLMQQLHQVIPQEQHMMLKEYAPYMQPIQQRSPTVGEILGIKPGSTPGI